MTTRRRFLAANLFAAVGFGSGVGRRPFAEAVKTGHLAASVPTSLDQRDFWNDWSGELTRSMNRARDARLVSLAGVKSTDQAKARIEMVRGTLWQLLGGPLERTPVNATITGKLHRPGFTVEKLVYESVQNVFVTANLYLPATGDPPFPAILAPIGHSANGKAYRSYQHFYQTLARLGYVVLTYDPWGQGERLQYINPSTGLSRMEPTDEHSMAGRPMILLGDSLAQYFAWDGIRGVDYLLSRPEVDPHRIGCTGQSGGGTMTMYLAALEPRIAAAVVNEGNTENVAGPLYDPPGAIDDAEQNIVGSLPLNLDRGDILAAAAPKPLLICYTTHDEGETYSPVYDQATQEVYREAASLYTLLGASEKIALQASYLPHGLGYTNRQHTYRWFNRWFKGQDGPVTELPLDDFPEAMLNATETGQVATSLRGRSSVQVNRDRLQNFIERRRAQPLSPDQLRSTLSSLLKWQPTNSPFKSTVLSSTPRPESIIEEFAFESEPGVRIPGWFLRPSSAARYPVVLCISDDCGSSLVKEPGSMNRVLAAGYAVCAISPRGLGVSRPRFPNEGPNYYSPISLVAERYAWAWLALGWPVVGQRVSDVIRAMDYLTARPDVDPSKVWLLGSGSAGLAAQMAALLDSRPRSLLLDATLISFAALVASPDYSLDLSWIVPGLLQNMDLPDIAGALLPRPCWIRNSVDPTGAILDRDAVQSGYLDVMNQNRRLPDNLHVIIELGTDPQTAYLDWLRAT